MIVLSSDLDVAQDNNANMLLTKVLDSIILILFLTQLLPVTDAMVYAMMTAQGNLFAIIHTAPIVSTLSYTINIRIPRHHGKTIVVLQVTLKITEAVMILLHLYSSNKIIQGISSFLLKELNFELLLCQSTLFQFEFEINSLTIYTEYFTHVVLKCYSDV